MSQGSRPDRVADQIRHELATMLARDVHDPGIGFVTLTRVHVTPDLQQARVFYTSLGDDTARRNAARALERNESRAAELAGRYVNSRGFMYVGRGATYPAALEGALKLKEISYVHAEGYAAGEMKHGPIALIEPAMAVVAVTARGPLAEKMRSNIEQVRARGGPVIGIGSDPESFALADERVEIPECPEHLSPILNVIPLQLLAYHMAALKGADIDKPRNLAKTVTVE